MRGMQESTLANTSNLFQFLQHYSDLKVELQSQHKPTQRIWFYEWPALPEITHILQDKQVPEDNHYLLNKCPLLSVEKPQENSPPALPDEISNYVDGDIHNHKKAPELKIVHGTLSQDQTLVMMRIWQAYIKTWQAWAKTEENQQIFREMYDRLLKIYQELSRAPEQYELRVGLGYLLRREDDLDQGRHLVSLGVQIKLSETGQLAVWPKSHDMPHQNTRDAYFIQDGLHENQKASQDVVKAINNILEDEQKNLWHGQILPPLLQTWLNASGLKNNSHYSPNLEISFLQANEEAVISFAPALILQASQHQGLSKIYDQLAYNWPQQKSLHSLLAVMAGIDKSNNLPKDTVDSANTKELLTELCFALPTSSDNWERETLSVLADSGASSIILPSLDEQTAILANLLTHLLAKQKRVLLTGPNFDNITELISALPTQWQDILRKLAERRFFDGFTTDIGELRQYLEQLEDKADELSLEISQLSAESENDIKTTKYQGGSQEIIEKLEQEQEQFNWLAEVMSLEQQSQLLDDEAPLSSQEALSWWQQQRQLSVEELMLLDTDWPKPDELATKEQFSHWCQTEAKAQEQLSKLEQGTVNGLSEVRQHPHYHTILGLAFTQQRQLQQHLERLQKASQPLSDIVPEAKQWLPKWINARSEAEIASWQLLESRASDLLPELLDNADWLDKVKVTGLEGHEPDQVMEDAGAMHDHLKEGGKWTGPLGLGVALPAIVRSRLYLKTDVRVRGLPANNPKALIELRRFLRLNKKLEEMIKICQGLGLTITGSYKSKIQLLSAQMDTFEKLQSLPAIYRDGKLAFHAAKLESPDWEDQEAQKQYLQVLKVSSIDRQLNDIAKAFEDKQNRLKNFCDRKKAHPIVDNLLAAMKQRNINDYAQEFEKLSSFESSRQGLVGQSLRRQVLQEKAPQLYDAMLETVQDEHWRQRLEKLEEAWQWLKAKQVLHLNDKSAEIAEASQELVETHEKIVQARCNLGVAKTKLHSSQISKSANSLYFDFGSFDQLLAKYQTSHQTQSNFDFDIALVLDADQVGLEALFVATFADKLLLASKAQTEASFSSASQPMLQPEQVSELLQHYLPQTPRYLQQAVSSNHSNLLDLVAGIDDCEA